MSRLQRFGFSAGLLPGPLAQAITFRALGAERPSYSALTKVSELAPAQKEVRVMDGLALVRLGGLLIKSERQRREMQ